MPPKKRKTPKIAETRHPVLFEINARILLSRLRRGKSGATFDDVPDALLDEWRDAGYDAVWMMGVWQTGEVSRQIARTHEGLQEEYRKVLPDVAPEDVQGSPYSVQAYHVPDAWGGDDALRGLRRRLADRGMSLILDFVSNHTARDHAWVNEHPEYYIHGTPGDDEQRPDIFFKTETAQGWRVLAYGRDPTFPGWTDTAQLNHLSVDGRKAILGELRHIATLCDGVRCDMAMLLLNSVYLLTWGEMLRNCACAQVMSEFWTEAVEEIRRDHPHFIFIAEAYWNLEWELQQRGFNFTYDKVLYDRLLREGAGAVRDHLRAEKDFQHRSLRFIENHDESRACRSFSSLAWEYAAAVVMSTIPGMVMFHDGQETAARHRLPIQLMREPEETPVEEVRIFYRRLLKTVSHPVFRDGEWSMLPLKGAWHDNWTWQNFLVFWWSDARGDSRMVVVNYAPHTGQCYVEMPLEKLDGQAFEFADLMSDRTYVRDKVGLSARGMYFDLPGYGFHIFKVAKIR
jgi:hypothetical protein